MASSAIAPSTTRFINQVKTQMTMTEKILARASDKRQLGRGDNIWFDVVLMIHDVGGLATFGIFEREFGQNAKVWDREEIVKIPDHTTYLPLMNEQTVTLISAGISAMNKIANPDYKGVFHVAFAQEGHCRPEEVLLGTDSHTCTAGAFGQFATGIGHTDAGFVLGPGKVLLKIIRDISVSGATYKAMEFVGTTFESLKISFGV